MFEKIIEALDARIANLQKARAIVSDSTESTAGSTKGKRGRPKGSKNVTASTPKPTKRVLSEEARARISAAVKKRHAASKRAAKKAAAKDEQNAA